MAGSERSGRPTPRLAAAAALAVVGVAAAVLLVAPPPRSTPAASPLAAASPSVASPHPARARPPPPPRAPTRPGSASCWLPLAPVATLEPGASDEAGIAPDARLTLTSLTGEPAVGDGRPPPCEPRGGAGRGRRARPADRDHRGERRARTRHPVPLRAWRPRTGRLAASWAFRVRSPVHVLSTIPGDRTTAVPVADRHRGDLRPGRGRRHARPLHDRAGRAPGASSDTAAPRSSCPTPSPKGPSTR